MGEKMEEDSIHKEFALLAQKVANESKIKVKEISFSWVDTIDGNSKVIETIITSESWS